MIGKGVYFAQLQNADGFIKVGFSRNIHRRIRSLEQGMPYSMKLIAFLPGDMADEQRIHKALKRADVEPELKGEWYRPEGKVAEYINKNRITP